MRRLLLWDIDGTLIRGGGVGTEALYRAASSAAGESIAPGSVVMHGKTDPQILTEIFLEAEIAHEAIVDLLPLAVTEAERLMAAAVVELRTRGELLPGVLEVLKATGAVPGVRQTLLTGNLVGNAARKLEAFDLTHFFDFEVGAYGTDHADRNELVPIARARVEQRRGERYDDVDVWVIGDTPSDVACAHAGNARCLLVATGFYDASALRDLGAEAVLDDLTATDEVVATLTGDARV